MKSRDALPVETRLYVPKMRALLKLRENAALDRLPAKGLITIAKPALTGRLVLPEEGR
jgi:hypothetical protein